MSLPARFIFEFVKQSEQMQFKMVAVTANARYIHTALGLRYLVAALETADIPVELLELTIDESPSDAVEKILRDNPKVVLLSVHIWNTELLTQVASLIRQLRPDVRLAAGGPEVSHGSETHPIFPWVDVIVQGEAERIIVDVVKILRDEAAQLPKIIRADPPDLSRVPLPYHLYSDEDIQQRVLYIETSRGCPLRCQFCLSSLDEKVRRFPENAISASIERLWQRGARRFKFVDRALHLGAALPLLDYFLEKKSPDLFLHFELIPDRLSFSLFERLRAFPKGQIQLEAGIQTLNQAVSERISRKQNIEMALDTLRSLREQTGVHIHADLVVGLPGEDLMTFAEGFNRLYSLDLHEIQIGILKKLRGAPIAEHDEAYAMVYNPRPPYDILQTRDIDFQTLQQLKRFAKYFDLVCNRGHFRQLLPLLIEGDAPFTRFWDLSAYLYEVAGRSHGIALRKLSEMLETYAVERKGIPKDAAARAIEAGLRTGDRQEQKNKGRGLPERQRRHL